MIGQKSRASNLVNRNWFDKENNAVLTGSGATARVIGHRGSSIRYTENTMEAFDGARLEKADGLEFDVRRTADGVLVVHHDPDLGDGRLISRTASTDLPTFIPTLRAVLDVYGSMWLNVEIKNDAEEPDYDQSGGLPRAVTGDVLAHHNQPDRSAGDGTGGIVVSSFDEPTLRHAMEAFAELTDATSADASTIGFGFLVWCPPAEQGSSHDLTRQALATAAALGCSAIHPHNPLVTESLVADAHGLGLEVNVWTVDDPDRIVELDRMGVDGIITNDPAGAAVALAR